MQPVFAAALDLQAVLEETGRPFCFIGGLAIQRWGEPRMTNDVDATLITSFVLEEELVRLLFSRFESRREDGLAFSLRNRGSTKMRQSFRTSNGS